MSAEDGRIGLEEIAAWRQAQRAELVSRRERIAHAQRDLWNGRITAHLTTGFQIPPEAIVGFCWPYKGEYDARDAMQSWREQGVTPALPEIIAKAAPLQFRKWWPAAPMRRGLYDIPVPERTEVLVPDILVVPMNAFDARGFRLGYGGGYFDATIAALERRVISIGVAYELACVETIHPQPHDIAMDFVVTETGIRVAGGVPLSSVEPAESRKCFAALLAARRLPRATRGQGGYSSPVCYAAEFPGYFGDDS